METSAAIFPQWASSIIWLGDRFAPVVEARHARMAHRIFLGNMWGKHAYTLDQLRLLLENCLAESDIEPEG